MISLEMAIPAWGTATCSSMIKSGQRVRVVRQKYDQKWPSMIKMWWLKYDQKWPKCAWPSLQVVRQKYDQFRNWLKRARSHACRMTDREAPKRGGIPPDALSSVRLEPALVLG